MSNQKVKELLGKSLGTVKQHIAQLHKQEFEIKTDFSSSEKTEAIQKAKDTPAFKPHQAPRSKLPLKY